MTMVVSSSDRMLLPSAAFGHKSPQFYLSGTVAAAPMQRIGKTPVTLIILHLYLDSLICLLLHLYAGLVKFGSFCPNDPGPAELLGSPGPSPCSCGALDLDAESWRTDFLDDARPRRKIHFQPGREPIGRRSRRERAEPPRLTCSESEAGCGRA